MFESLFVAAALGAGGPAPVPLPAAPAPQPAEETRPRVYPLRSASAQIAATAVATDLRAAGLAARLGFDLQSNSVLVQGPAAAHARVVEFLPRFEDQSRDELRVIRLRHVTAADFARGATIPALVADRGQLVVSSCVAAERAGPFVEVAAVAPAPRELTVVTAAYHLRNVAAGDIAEAVGAALGTGREVRIDVRAAENQLVVTGSPATHARVVELVGGLDRRVPQVHVSMTIAEVPVAFLTDCGLTKAGAGAGGCFSLKARERELFTVALRNYPGSSMLSRPDLLVRENQTGYVAVGQDVPVGAPVVPAGTPEMRLVGVTVRVTPRVMPDGKVMLRVEPQTCSPAPPPVVIRAGATAFPFNVQTVQTTVVSPSGETVLLAMEKTGADGRPVALLVVLTPSVVRP